MPKMGYMEVEDDLEVVANRGNLGKMLEKKIEKEESKQNIRYVEKKQKREKNGFNWDNYSNIQNMEKIIKRDGHEDLQKFTLEDCIGKGSESLVFKIRLNNSNNHYVLKVLKRHKNRINYTELTISRKLKNKYIANTLCYYADPKKEFDYIIMELGNSNLSHFMKKTLKRPTMSESFLCLIAYQSLQGLLYLHTNKIIHQDIKPQNIIITDYLDIKLIDLSVSSDYSEKKETFKLHYAGTQFFMSPEVIKGKTVLTKDLQKIDLFSLGVTLYVLAFGCYPFDFTKEDDDEEIYQKINSDWKVTDKNNNFSRHFIDLLNGLLEKDINKRVNIFQALNSYFVQGAKILLDEKEKTYNANSFLSYIITDHIRPFQEYISN